MQAIFQRDGNTLRPTDEQSGEMLAGIKHKEQVRVDFKRMRNPNQHRLYWALMGLLATYVDGCTADDCHEWMKRRVGHTYEAIYPDGTTVTRTKSIAFGNMSQAEFEAFFNKVVNTACVDILHGTSNNALKAELSDMIAPRQAA